MLQALTVDRIETIISAAERLIVKYPPSELGISGGHDITPYLNDSRELEHAIAPVSYDARMELMALMWLGREREEWNFGDAVTYAKKHSDQGDVRYITEKAPSLPLYLREGMRKTGLSN